MYIYIFCDLLLGEGFDPLGHPAGHGALVGPGQPGVVQHHPVQDGQEQQAGHVGHRRLLDGQEVPVNTYMIYLKGQSLKI